MKGTKRTFKSLLLGAALTIAALPLGRAVAPEMATGAHLDVVAGGEIIGQLDLQKVDTFSLEYTQSLYQEFQAENYAVVDGALYLVGMTFGGDLSMQYYDPNFLGAVSRSGGFIEAKLAQPKAMEQVVFRNAALSDLTLRHGAETVSLRQIAAPGEVIELTVNAKKNGRRG